MSETMHGLAYALSLLGELPAGEETDMLRDRLAIYGVIVEAWQARPPPTSVRTAIDCHVAALILLLARARREHLATYAS